MARVVFAGVALLLGWQIWLFGHVLWWVHHNPSTTAFIEMRRTSLEDSRPGGHIAQNWVPYERISPNLKRAVIAAEDANFLDHEGFDWDGIERAWEKNLKRGRIVAGGSTISQQLAKNLFLSEGRTPWRKAEEALITVMLEQTMSKRRILEIYLNVIEWGVGVFGADAAARHYFGVGADRLGPEQSARLAAMIPNPAYYDRNRATRHLQRKTQIILARMGDADLP